MIKKLLFVLLLLPTLGAAAVPTWKIVANQSSITFTATQNGAPVSGGFKTFSGEINFDPNQLKTSNVHIVVDTGSVTASYGQVTDTLKTPDWFNVKVFPQAVFKANNFIKTGDKTYQADGTLTIRDKTVPVKLDFTLDEYTNDKAHVKGSTLIKRTQFGVGQGDWAKTDAIKDDVKVDFTLAAVKK